MSGYLFPGLPARVYNPNINTPILSRSPYAYLGGFGGGGSYVDLSGGGYGGGYGGGGGYSAGYANPFTSSYGGYGGGYAPSYPGYGGATAVVTATTSAPTPATCTALPT